MAYLQITLCDQWEPGERPKTVCVLTRDGEAVVYVPERTCRMVPVVNGRVWKCSECGQVSLVEARGGYCPRCGARVVEAAS